MTETFDAVLAGKHPKFGDWVRGNFASEQNPKRDGMFVRVVRRAGRLNPGTFYELTDGKGKLWQYEAKHTTRLQSAHALHAALTAALTECREVSGARVVAWVDGEGHIWPDGDLIGAEEPQDIPLVLASDYAALRARLEAVEARIAAARVGKVESIDMTTTRPTWHVMDDDPLVSIAIGGKRVALLPVGDEGDGSL